MLKNQMDAEEVVQDVLLRMWNNLGKFNLLSAKAWLMRTTHNLCLDYIRRNNSLNKREPLISESFENRMKDESIEGNPDSLMNKNFIKENIMSAVENLPERLKTPFVMYQIDGLKYKEISKILDIPMSSVKINILRARQQLRKELKEYETEKSI